MTSLPEPTVRATCYEVSCLPEDDFNAPAFLLRVECRGRELWAVTDGVHCLGTDGSWAYERTPSNREESWLKTHRFPLDEALRRAKELAPKVTVNGHTVAEALRSYAERTH